MVNQGKVQVVDLHKTCRLSSSCLSLTHVTPPSSTHSFGPNRVLYSALYRDRPNCTQRKVSHAKLPQKPTCTGQAPPINPIYHFQAPQKANLYWPSQPPKSFCGLKASGTKTLATGNSLMVHLKTT